MSALTKVVLAAVGFGVLLGGSVLQDWYRFAKTGDIDPQRGIFGNDHLEVWIDINAAMPTPMRKWACKTLLDRQTAILGGEGPAPYGCAADFDPNAAPTVMSKAIIDSLVTTAGIRAESSGASVEQVAAIKACMATEFVAKIPADQITALDSATPDPVVMSTLSQTGQAAGTACLAAAGIN